MKKTLGVGVIGLGRLGYQHTVNVTRTMGARLVAVSDPFPAALERGKEDFGVTAYADYKDMTTIEIAQIVQKRIQEILNLYKQGKSPGSIAEHC